MVYLVASFLIFWLYLIYVWKKHGAIKSISDSYFVIKKPFLFRSFIFGISIPMILYSANENTGIFIAGLLIMAVGFAPGFKGKGHKIESRNHVIGATGGILAGYASFGIEYVDWSSFGSDLFFWSIIAFLISALVILPIGGLKKSVKNCTWYIEIFAYNIIILTLIIKNLI